VVTSKQATFAHTTYTNYGTTIVTLSTEAGIVINVNQQPFVNIIVSPSTHFPIFVFCFFWLCFLSSRLYSALMVGFNGFERNLDGGSTFNSITGSTKQFGERMDRLPKTVSSRIIIAHIMIERIGIHHPLEGLSISFLIAQ
jgi:hypothetical protein